MPSLAKHVPWEAYGERAALMISDRRPGLENAVSQPERMSVEVDGKNVSYTPDYQLTFINDMAEVLEVKGEQQLLDERTQKKLAAAELVIAMSGRRFRVLNSTTLTKSMELRNVQLLRRYATWPVSREQADSILSGFRAQSEISLNILVDAASQFGIVREQIYALIYRNTLDHDWSILISDSTQIRVGKSL